MLNVMKNAYNYSFHNLFCDDIAGEIRTFIQKDQWRESIISIVL